MLSLKWVFVLLFHAPCTVYNNPRRYIYIYRKKKNPLLHLICSFIFAPMYFYHHHQHHHRVFASVSILFTWCTILEASNCTKKKRRKKPKQKQKQHHISKASTQFKWCADQNYGFKVWSKGLPVCNQRYDNRWAHRKCLIMTIIIMNGRTITTTTATRYAGETILRIQPDEKKSRQIEDRNCKMR